MSDNPFAEPGDGDRTVIRGPGGAVPPRPVPVQGAGMPGGVTPVSGPMDFAQRGPAPQRPATTPAVAGEAAQRLAGEAENLPKVGVSPLVAAATPLLDLLGRLANGGAVRVPDASELRERAIRALRQFEIDAREAQISPEQMRPAHYALCSALDDVALSTPWGNQSVWAVRTLCATFHQEVVGGGRFFQMLAAMQKEPARYFHALEVCYFVLALGMQGMYRLTPRGASDLDRIREGLYQLLVQLRGNWERELSPHWRGVDQPHKGLRRGIPPWFAVCFAALGLGLGYWWLSEKMNESSDTFYARMAALPPGRIPEIERREVVRPPEPAPPPVLVTVPNAQPAPPPPPDPMQRFRAFLEPEIREGLVEVLGDSNRLVVRIKNRGMFASGSATVEARFVDLLRRIGAEIRNQPGRVQVMGHTDNQPIRTVRFPSNFHLSTARAEAALAIMAAAAGDVTRFRSEGRADSEPVGDNNTAQGREQNRRVEIILVRQGS